VIVPTRWLNFDVLTDSVKAKLLCQDNITEQCLVCWSGVESIWPPTLVQWAIHKDWLAVECHTEMTLIVTLLSELAKSCIRLGAIYNLTILLKGYVEVI
jgi:hypothetical protein